MRLSRSARAWSLGRFPSDSGKIAAALPPYQFCPRSSPSFLAVPCSTLLHPWFHLNSGYFPHSLPITGAVRRAISGTRLTGALGLSQGTLHRPVPLLCWGLSLTLPGHCLMWGYSITVLSFCQGTAWLRKGFFCVMIFLEIFFFLCDKIRSWRISLLTGVKEIWPCPVRLRKWNRP